MENKKSLTSNKYVENPVDYRYDGKKILRRYIPFVIIITIAVTIFHFKMQDRIVREGYLSDAYNISLNQELLSQQIAKDVWALCYLEEGEKGVYQDELADSLLLWNANHDKLIEINQLTGITSEQESGVRALFTSIEKRYQKINEAANRILLFVNESSYSQEDIIDDVMVIQEYEKLFRNGMDKIVDIYRAETTSRIRFLSFMEGTLIIVIFTMISFEILFIFIPGGKSLKKAMEKIDESQGNLLKLFRMSSGAMFLVDQSNFQVFLMNQVAEEFTGISLTQTPGREIFLYDIIEFLSKDQIEIIKEINIHDKNENIEIVIDTKMLKNRTVHLNTEKIVFQNRAAILIGIFDITNQREAEEILKNQAYTDELTGLHNRYYLYERVDEEITRSDRYAEPLSLIIFDLDHFKKVNDTYGHPVGDDVLKETAQIAKHCIRQSDILVRLGGEEFLVLLPTTKIDGALATAEKMREQLATYQHPEAGIVTASFGVVERSASESFQSLYAKVDEALYQAKNSGRNKVVVTGNKNPLPIALVKIEWHREWESGNNEIDRQHREIIRIANDIMRISFKPEKNNAVSERMIDLINFVEKHFRYEEQLQKDLGYPDADSHALIHVKLIDKLEKLNIESISDISKTAKLLSFMVDDLIIGHMSDFDTLFFPYIGKENE